MHLHACLPDTALIGKGLRYPPPLGRFFVSCRMLPSSRRMMENKRNWNPLGDLRPFSDQHSIPRSLLVCPCKCSIGLEVIQHGNAYLARIASVGTSPAGRWAVVWTRARCRLIKASEGCESPPLPTTMTVVPIPQRSIRISIDRGGTFTDVCASIVDSKSPTGRSEFIIKLLSQDPSNYADAPTEGIRRVLERVTGKSVPRGVPLPADLIGE